MNSSKHDGWSGHHRGYEGQTNEWLTPPEIIQAVGPFDLDPCSPINRPWNTANKHYTIEDDGLAQDWGSDFVWMNPPYGPHTKVWMKKLSEHNNGIALIFARTDTEYFQKYVFNKADCIFFLAKRLYFHYIDGSKSKNNSGAPSVLIGYGEKSCNRLSNCPLEGKFVTL